MQAVQKLARGLFVVLLSTVALGQDDPGDDVALRAVVVPTGYNGGRYSAMVQLAVDGSPLPNAAWELGFSFEPKGRPAQEFSGRVVAGEPETPVVFEAQVSFAPGAFAMQLDAQETTAGQGGTRRVSGLWPDPGTERATISPIVLLQPAQGAFLRGENAQAQGALALGEDDELSIELPTAAISVVCRGTDMPYAMKIERKLEGATSVAFEPIELRPGQDQCAQVRDIMPPGSLGLGHFRYRVEVRTADDEIGSRERKFFAIKSGS